MKRVCHVLTHSLVIYHVPCTMYHLPFGQTIYHLVIYHVPFIWLFEHLSLCIEEMSVALDVEDAVNHPFTI